MCENQKNILDKIAISDLKFRATYGLAGNNRIDDYLYRNTYTTSGYYGLNGNIVNGYTPNSYANPKIKWENTISRNVGVDVSFLNGALQLVVDAYKNTTKDLLVNVPLSSLGFPSGSGVTQQIQNVGEIENTGLDFQLSATILRGKKTGDFKWSANFNIAYNQNEIKSLGLGQDSYQWNSGWGSTYSDYIVKVGQSLGAMYGFELEGDGIYHTTDFTDGTYLKLKDGVPNDAGILGTGKFGPQPGMLKLKWHAASHSTSEFQYKQDSVTAADRTIIGNTNPKFIGGLTQQFSYKNFDLNIFVNFVIGVDVLNANSVEYTNGYYTDANMLTSMNNRWRIVDNNGALITDAQQLETYNTGKTMWRPLTNANMFIHNKNVEDGSFLRINNISLGYTLPASITSKVHLSRVRFYGTVNNLAIITNYSGYDPEVSTRRSTPMTPNVDYSAYPRSRMYVFGVNVNF